MKVTLEKQITVFEAIRKVKTHDRLKSYNIANIPVDVNDLIVVVGEITETWIDVREADFAAEFVRGMLERYADKKVYIWVRRDQSDDYKNLTTAKELSHLLIDTAEDFSTDGRKTIEKMVESKTNSDAQDHPPIVSELLAEYSAFEIMYPFEFRENDKKHLDAGNETLKSLSIRYDIPEYVIGRVHAAAYSVWAAAMWKMLG
jgi:Zn-dependent peptidase ImmA (M78 family)